MLDLAYHCFLFISSSGSVFTLHREPLLLLYGCGYRLSLHLPTPWVTFICQKGDDIRMKRSQRRLWVMNIVLFFYNCKYSDTSIVCTYLFIVWVCVCEATKPQSLSSLIVSFRRSFECKVTWKPVMSAPPFMKHMNNWESSRLSAPAPSRGGMQSESHLFPPSHSPCLCLSPSLSLPLPPSARTFSLNLLPSIVSLQPWNCVSEEQKSREKSLAWILADAVIRQMIQRLAERRKR